MRFSTTAAINAARRHDSENDLHEADARRPSSSGGTPLHAEATADEILEDLNEETPKEAHLELTTKELIHGVVAGFPIDREPEDRRWVWASMVVTNCIFLVIGVSVIAFGVETLPQYKDGRLAFDVIEAVCVAIFTIEFLVRLPTARSQVAFWSSPLTWIDLLSILPYYIMLMINDDSSGASFAAFRVLRLIRVVRVFKLVKNDIGFEAVFESMVQSKDALSLMGFMLVVAVATFSAAIYFAEVQDNTFDEEREQWIRPNGEVNPYQSMFHAFWWCIVTITTVGYGDDVPITGLGKAIASFAAVCGVFVISFPTAILGANFAEIHAKKLAERDEKLRRARKMRTEGEPAALRGTPPTVGTSTEAILRSTSTANTNGNGNPMTLPAVASPTHGAVGPKLLTYLPDDDVPPRELLVTATQALYSPALIMQTQEQDRFVLVARREETFPPPGRNLVLTLILSCESIHDLVVTTVELHGYDPQKLSIVPRPVDVLRISVSLPESLVELGIRLQSTEFKRPSGHVPVVFFCPNDEAEHKLVAELHTVEFSFDVSYEATSRHVLPLANYRTASLVRSKNVRTTGNMKRAGSHLGVSGSVEQPSQSPARTPDEM